MASIRKRHNHYHVQIRRRGHKSISKSFTQKSDALKWARAVEIQFDQSHFENSTLMKVLPLTFTKIAVEGHLNMIV